MTVLSIIAATYGHTEHQLRCLIHSVLGQTFTDLKLYVLQDGPDPNNIAKTMCESIKDSRLVYEESIINHGKWGFPNRNKKLFEISSKYVAFQSCDNYVTPKAYEYLVSVAEEHSLDVAFCNIVHNYPNINAYNIDGSIDKSKLSPPYSVLDSMLQLNKIDLTNFIVKTRLAKDIGGFNLSLPEALLAGADGFFIMDLLKKNRGLKAAKVNSCLFVHN